MVLVALGPPGRVHLRRGQEQLGVEAEPVVRVDVVERDRPAAVHDVDGGHREGVPLRGLEDDAEPPGQGKPVVARDREGEAQARGQLRGLAGAVGSDGDQAVPLGPEPGQEILQLDQLPRAVRSPVAAVEDQHRRLPVEEGAECGALSARGPQGAVRDRGSDQGEA